MPLSTVASVLHQNLTGRVVNVSHVVLQVIGPPSANSVFLVRFTIIGIPAYKCVSNVLLIKYLTRF